MLSILPLSHAYECTLGLVIPILVGCSVSYLDKPPTARVLLPAMEKVRPTIILSVPLIIEKIFKTRILPRFTQKKVIRGLYRVPMIRKKLHKAAGKKVLKLFGGELKSFCIGGASLAPDVELFLREAGFPYAIGYGLTETAPLVAGTDPAGTRLRSTGKPLPGIEIKIENPNPQTGEGEILIRGPVVMQGYYNDPGRTKEVLTQDGWFHSGDLGAFDSDGYLYIKGRLKNMILGPSGENIYPEEIEAVINEHESVLESLVFEQEGQLVARVYLNYEELDVKFAAQKLDDSQAKALISTLLEEIRTGVNLRVSTFSRINKIIEQSEPFVKTPTQKIKRYLYV
jgi:long-chain acyl-CoA synthetase